MYRVMNITSYSAKANISDIDVVSPIDFGLRIPDNEAAREYLEWRRWGGKPVCPACGSPAKLWKCRPGYYKCGNRKCMKGFTVRSNSIFSRSHIPLHHWLHAIYTLLTEMKGKSSRQLGSRIAKVKSYKSAWHLGHRIREVMAADKKNIMLSSDIEADESPFSGKRKGKHWDKKKNDKKTWVMGMKERNGKVVLKVLPDTARLKKDKEVITLDTSSEKLLYTLCQSGININELLDTLYKTGKVTIKKDKIVIVSDTSSEMLLGILCKYVDIHSTIFTDGNPAYNKVGSLFYDHNKTIHKDKIYVVGDSIHTNGIESIWRLAKDSYRAVYYRPSPTHLQRYLDELMFRWNNKTDKEPIMEALGKFVDLCWGVTLPWDKLVPPKKTKQAA